MKQLRPRTWESLGDPLFHLKMLAPAVGFAALAVFAAYLFVVYLGDVQTGLVFGGIPVAVCAIGGLVASFETSGNKTIWAWDVAVLWICLGALIGAVIASTVAGLKFAVPLVFEAYSRVASVQTRAWLIALAALATLVVGSLFFWFRLRQRFLYGATEAMAGAAVAAHRLSVEPGQGLPGDGGFYIAILTAGVYLVVRGLDNMHQALAGGTDAVVGWYRQRKGRGSGRKSAVQNVPDSHN